MVGPPTNDAARPPGKADLAVPAASATAGAAVPPRCREIVAWAITHGRDSVPWGEGTEAFALLGELVRMAQASPQVVPYLISVIENRSAGANASFGGQPERFLMEALAETGNAAAMPVLTAQLLRPDEASSDARRRWRAAAIALGRLRDPRAIPLLKQAHARGRAPKECQESIEQLGGLGPVAAPATPPGREEPQEADRAAAEPTPDPTERRGPAPAPPVAPAIAPPDTPAPAPPVAPPGESRGAAEPQVVAPPDAQAEQPGSTVGAPVPMARGVLQEADPERTEPPDAMPEQEASAAALAPAPPAALAPAPPTAEFAPAPPAAAVAPVPPAAAVAPAPSAAEELAEAAMGRRPASVPPPAPGSDLEEAVRRYSRIADLFMTRIGQDGAGPPRPSAGAVREAIQRADKAPQDWSAMPALWPDLIRVAVTSLPLVREDEARRVLLVLAHRARLARGGLDATLTGLFNRMAGDGEGCMASGGPVDGAGRMLIRNIKTSRLSPSVVHLTLRLPGSKTSHLVVRIGPDEYLLLAH